MEKKDQQKSGEVAIRDPSKGDPFYIEVELDMKVSHIRFIDLIN